MRQIRSLTSVVPADDHYMDDSSNSSTHHHFDDWAWICVAGLVLGTLNLLGGGWRFFLGQYSRPEVLDLGKKRARISWRFSRLQYSAQFIRPNELNSFGVCLHRRHVFSEKSPPRNLDFRSKLMKRTFGLALMLLVSLNLAAVRAMADSRKIDCEILRWDDGQMEQLVIVELIVSPAPDRREIGSHLRFYLESRGIWRPRCA